MFIGYPGQIYQSEDELSIIYVIGNRYAVPIVEGCNSMSIIILFLAFIVAFSGSLKATILYGLVGIATIYFMNILRILALSKLMYLYPDHQEILHGLVFPSIIYGTVLILWIIWVNKFSYLKKKR